MGFCGCPDPVFTKYAGCEQGFAGNYHHDRGAEKKKIIYVQTSCLGWGSQENGVRVPEDSGEPA
jgi:hypothetical protein